MSEIGDLLEPVSRERLAETSPHPLYWSLRRELWENRSICIAPSIAAAVTVFGSFIATMVKFSTKGATLDVQTGRLVQQYAFAALAIMATTFVVAIFYCLDALRGERVDGSILFWKSLPVSDVTTVLAKAAIPLAVLPLLTFVITIAAQFSMLLLNSAVLLISGQSAVAHWVKVPWAEMSSMLLYHLVTVHSLYYAPIFAWLLLVSAWARRMTFVWAFLPLAAIVIVEKIVFNTAHFATILGSRLSGGMQTDATANSVMMLGGFHPAAFVSSAELWIGLAIAAAFLAAAVRLRRYRGPI